MPSIFPVSSTITTAPIRFSASMRATDSSVWSDEAVTTFRPLLLRICETVMIHLRKFRSPDINTEASGAHEAARHQCIGDETGDETPEMSLPGNMDALL